MKIPESQQFYQQCHFGMSYMDTNRRQKIGLLILTGNLIKPKLNPGVACIGVSQRRDPSVMSQDLTMLPFDRDITTVAKVNSKLVHKFVKYLK